MHDLVSSVTFHPPSHTVWQKFSALPYLVSYVSQTLPLGQLLRPEKHDKIRGSKISMLELRHFQHKLLARNLFIQPAITQIVFTYRWTSRSYAPSWWYRYIPVYRRPTIYYTDSCTAVRRTIAPGGASGQSVKERPNIRLVPYTAVVVSCYTDSYIVRLDNGNVGLSSGWGYNVNFAGINFRDSS